MIVRCNACSADPCARWKPPPARIFILSESTGAFETSPVRLPRSLVAEAGGRDSKVGKRLLVAEGRTAMNAQQAQPTRRRTQPPWTIARRRRTTLR